MECQQGFEHCSDCEKHHENEMFSRGRRSEFPVLRVEIYEMAGCGTFDEFLKNWSPIPILPGIGGAPRFLAVLTRRINCVAGHRPLRRAPSSTAPVPNGPCIAEECPTNFGPICNATWHFIPRVWECDLLLYEMPRHSQRCRNARTLLKWRQKWSGTAAIIFWQGYVNDLKERFEFPFCLRQLWQMPW